MKALHVVPEINEANGVYRVARMLACESGGDVIDARQFQSTNPNNRTIEQFSEIWVHGMWLPREWKACWLVLRAGKRLVRMTHGSLSPIYLERQGKWKKLLVGLIERWLFKRTDRVVVTCEEEKKWCQQWGLENEVEILNLKRFFDLDVDGSRSRAKDGSLHVLYLGRRHPLKGVEFLEHAVREIQVKVKGEGEQRRVELRIVSDHFGEELERDWAWCDVLVLPTLSENFGLVVAEALERGKKVVTTDGAPAWEEGKMFECLDCSNFRIGYGGRLVYLKGYRDGTDEKRVELLKKAILRSESDRGDAAPRLAVAKE